MNGPTNGGTSPSSVAITTSQGSSIRRRASLYTQYANESQKTTAKRIRRLRITSQVPELKKSCTPPKVEAVITGASFLSSTRRETRRRRSRGARTRRRRTPSACRGRSPWYVLLLVQVGQEVQGAGDEDGAVRAGQLAGPLEGASGPGNGLDRLEVPARRRGERLGRERPAAGRGRGHERVPEHRERPQHQLGTLVGQDRGDDDVAAGRQARQQPADPRHVVGAVPELERRVAAVLHPAGETDGRGGRRIDVAAEEALGGGDGQREVRAGDDDDLVCALVPGELLPLRLAEYDRVARMDDGELLGGDLLPRRAEHVGVLERDARQDDDARVEDVRGVVAAAESGLDDGDAHRGRGERRQRRRGQRLELRRFEPLGRGPHACDGGLEVRLLAADADPLAPTAHVRRDVRADGQARVREQRLEHPHGRRLPVRADD